MDDIRDTHGSPGQLRRALLVSMLATGAAAIAPAALAQATPGAATSTGSGQAWPAKPIRVVVNFPPGGAADQLARMIGQPLSEALGQPVVIENRGGANGNIGGEAVARSPADGHTLLMKLDFMFDPGIGLQHVKAGKLKLLAVGSPRRSPLFPDVPTLDESGLANFDADSWFGFYAPAGTPAAVVSRLNTEINKITGSQAIRDRITAIGGVAAPMSPSDFGARASIDSVRFGGVIRARNIKGD